MMPARDAKAQATLLQTARIMWMAFLVAGCGFVALSHIIRNAQPQPAPSQGFVWALAVVGVVDVVIFGALRRSLLARSWEQSNGRQVVAARETWLKAQLLGFASAMSIVLFGFVLHLLGAQPPWISTVFFVAGLLSLAVYRPRPIESL
jgi:hypothetical protein